MNERPANGGRVLIERDVMNQFSPDDLYNATVYDRDGSKVGRVQQVYLDDSSGSPSWITVNTGFFGTNESLVPLEGAGMNEDILKVPFDKQQIKDAPNYDPGHHLDERDEDDLYRHYGLTGGTPAGTGLTDRDRDGHVGRDRDDRGFDPLDRDNDGQHFDDPDRGRDRRSGDDRAYADDRRRSDDPLTGGHEGEPLDPHQGRDPRDVSDHDAGGRSRGSDHDDQTLQRERELLERERDLLERDKELLQREQGQRGRLRRHDRGQGY